MLDQLAVGVALLRSDDLRLVYVNRALARSVGYEQEEIAGQHIDVMIPEGQTSAEVDRELEINDQLESAGRARFETEIRRKDGSALWVRVTITPLLIDGEPPMGVVVGQDVTEEKRALEALRFQAEHDPLTGVFNRRRFQDELERELSRSVRHGSGGAVLVLDLDDFKRVNDTRGHAAGDQLLAAVASALEARLRPTDVLARLGGDEFGVILPHADEAAARSVADDLCRIARDRARAAQGDGTPSIDVSAGIAMFGAGRRPVGGEELVVEADIAMYRAKRAGGARAATFESSRDD